MKSLTRFVEIVLCGLLLTVLAAPAYSATFGRTTVGTIASAGLRADFKRGSKFVLPEKGTFQEVCVYIDTRGSGTGTQALRFALYRDRNGLPADLVLEAASSPLASGQQPAFWYCTSSDAVPLDPGSYWVMIHSGGDPGVIRYYYDGPANWYGNADVFADGSSDAFGPGGAGDGTISMHVNYVPDTQLHFAGRRTIGSRVSSPMSSSFKRGSSFQLNEAAQLGSLSAYIDGLGGASGAQTLTLALYNDVNGEPSGLVAQGTVFFASPMAGRTGRWVTAYPSAERVPLTPGRYWIVLHTSGQAGVLRYYIDGTGNWRGNANAASAPSPIFGAASSGDGTASAFILYTPANVTQHTFGQTTVGTIPSKGLSADFIRGSGGTNPGPALTPLYVTALWAYVDGNGGATGSQKLRLAVYDQDETDPMIRVVQSGEVTIAAGTPPGWVRFAVPYTQITENRSYVMMMLTGGAAGVVRNYAGNEPFSWMGEPAPYANGAPGALYEINCECGQPVLQRGTGLVSIYGEYQTVPFE